MQRINYQSALGGDAPLEEYLCYSSGSANLRKSLSENESGELRLLMKPLSL
jgi:hypothetical protein